MKCTTVKIVDSSFKEKIYITRVTLFNKDNSSKIYICKRMLKTRIQIDYLANLRNFSLFNNRLLIHLQSLYLIYLSRNV